MRPLLLIILTLASVALVPQLAAGDTIYNFENYNDPDTGFSIQGQIETINGAHLDGLLTGAEIVDLDLTISNGVTTRSWDENDPFVTTSVSISEIQIFLARPPTPIGMFGTTANQFTVGAIGDGATGELTWVWTRTGFTLDELVIQHRSFLADDFDEDVTGLISAPETDVLVIASAVPEPSFTLVWGLVAGAAAFYRRR